MFADWELIGVPQGLKEGTLEYQGRRDAAATKLSAAHAAAELKARLS
jgi:prolyl-tRNA synthetase